MNKIFPCLIVVLILFSCKKEDTSTITYGISVKVDDGVNYKLEMSNGSTVYRDVNPSLSNTSFTTDLTLNRGSSGWVSVTTAIAFKDKFFDVQVTNKATGEIVKQEKLKEKVVLSWQAK